MKEDNFIKILRIIKKYAETQTSDLTLNEENIQLNSFATCQPQYKYIIDKERKLSYLQYLIHGAVNKIENKNELEDIIKNYIKYNLKLLWGMYFFIDPKEIKQDGAKSHYVVGAVDENDSLIPSFTFPHYSNLRNIRRNEEFQLYDDNWQEFYSRIVSAARGSIEFKNDFVKYFNSKTNDGSEIRRNEKEKENNFLYASSGELDHSILQWLFCIIDELNKIKCEKKNKDKIQNSNK